MLLVQQTSLWRFYANMADVKFGGHVSSQIIVAKHCYGVVENMTVARQLALGNDNCTVTIWADTRSGRYCVANALDQQITLRE